MKKLFLFTLIFLAIPTLAFAGNWSIVDKSYNGDSVTYHINCNPGMNMLTGNPSISMYWDSSGKIHGNLNAAVDATCNPKKDNIVTLRNKGLIFKKKSRIMGALVKENIYSICGSIARMGNEDIRIVKSGNVRALAYYKAHDVVVDEHGNYKGEDPDREAKLKSGEFRMSRLIDNYYKIQFQEGDIYYIRESDLNN